MKTSLFSLRHFLWMSGYAAVLTPMLAPPVQARTAAQNAAIIAPLRINIRGLQTENLNLAMSAIDPSSPIYRPTREFTIKAFAAYDLTYTMSNLKVLSVSANKARVAFRQVTRKVRGPAFQDNMLDGINLLRKTPRGWKLYSTKVTRIQYLN